MILAEWKNGDVLHRYQKSLVLLFNGRRRVLSTSIFHGGCRDDLKSVFNHDGNPGAGMACRLEAETYEEHLALIATRLGLEPASTTGISTAASMDNVAIQAEEYEKVRVTAIVTGGVEVNGGRVGDPAHWYEPKEESGRHRLGTINTILVVEGVLPPGIMARALITATEAKTAALQELMANSNYSTGIATGSGTDGTIIVSDCEAQYRFENAGKHSKLGELIGRAVMRATKEALAKQSGFTPVSMHRVTKRLKRFGISEDYFWELYCQHYASIPKYDFLASFEKYEQSTEWLVPTTLLIHLLDERQWGLITAEEVVAGASRLGLKCTADMSEHEWLTAWVKYLLAQMARDLFNE